MVRVLRLFVMILGCAGVWALPVEARVASAPCGMTMAGHIAAHATAPAGMDGGMMRTLGPSAPRHGPDAPCCHVATMPAFLPQRAPVALRRS
ncbi:hypothetical protein, partial [Ameyamaea chiangmaiensis]